jgi:hypothetical protein
MIKVRSRENGFLKLGERSGEERMDRIKERSEAKMGSRVLVLRSRH